MVGTAFAGFILGLVGVTAGSSLVQASEQKSLFGFLETLFRGPAPEPAPVKRPNRARYSSLPDARRLAPPRHHTPRIVVRPSDSIPMRSARPAQVRGPAPGVASAALTTSALGARTVCVRACDGYLFPLGSLGARRDLPVHAAACAAACPNASIRLYTLDGRDADLDRAVSLDGRPYRSLAVANLYRSKRVENCSCQPDGVAAAPLPIERDLTLRAGDVIATMSSAHVVARGRSGGLTAVDFRQAKGLSRRARREIDGKIDVVRREAEARAFRQALRAADRGPRIRLAAIGGFETMPAPIEVEPRFSAVRVVVPSPFVP